MLAWQLSEKSRLEAVEAAESVLKTAREVVAAATKSLDDARAREASLLSQNAALDEAAQLAKQKRDAEAAAATQICAEQVAELGVASANADAASVTLAALPQPSQRHAPETTAPGGRRGAKRASTTGDEEDADDDGAPAADAEDGGRDAVAKSADASKSPEARAAKKPVAKKTRR